MWLTSCEHPVKVYNKYLGKEIIAPCGKCNTCRNRRSFNWVQRLERESLSWKYCIFLTLTYNEKFVPRLVKVDHPVPVGHGDYALFTGLQN